MDRDFYQVVKENWGEILKNRVAWLFVLFANANSIYQISIGHSEIILLRCLEFIASIFILALSAIGQVGLIHIADNVSESNTYTFAEVWKHSKHSVLRVILINFLLGFLFLFPYLCLVFSSSPDSYQNSFFPVLFWVISILLVIIGTPSACAIVINNSGPLDGLMIGVRMFINRAWEMFLLGLTYLLIPMFVAILSYVLLYVMVYGANLTSSLPSSIQSYFEIVQRTPISVVLVIVNFLLLPLWVVLITHLYKGKFGELDLPR
jgi:hypothetical protein